MRSRVSPGLVPWSRAELRYLARRTWSSASPLASTRVCMRLGASQMRRGSGPPSPFRQARARPGTSATRTPPPGSLSPSEEMTIHPVAGTSTQHRGRVSSCRYSYRTQWRYPWLLAYYVTPPSGCGLRSDGKWKLADVLLGPNRRAFPSEARYCIVRNVHFGTEYRHDSDEPQVSIKRRAIHTYFFKITSRHHGARGRRPGPPIDPVLSSPAPECPFPKLVLCPRAHRAGYPPPSDSLFPTRPRRVSLRSSRRQSRAPHGPIPAPPTSPLPHTRGPLAHFPPCRTCVSLGFYCPHPLIEADMIAR